MCDVYETVKNGTNGYSTFLGPEHDAVCKGNEATMQQFINIIHLSGY